MRVREGGGRKFFSKVLGVIKLTLGENACENGKRNTIIATNTKIWPIIPQK